MLPEMGPYAIVVTADVGSVTDVGLQKGSEKTEVVALPSMP
jgi:hypothetical protein